MNESKTQVETRLSWVLMNCMPSPVVFRFPEPWTNYMYKRCRRGPGKLALLGTANVHNVTLSANWALMIEQIVRGIYFFEARPKFCFAKWTLTIPNKRSDMKVRRAQFPGRVSPQRWQLLVCAKRTERWQVARCEEHQRFITCNENHEKAGHENNEIPWNTLTLKAWLKLIAKRRWRTTNADSRKFGLEIQWSSFSWSRYIYIYIHSIVYSIIWLCV